MRKKKPVLIHGKNKYSLLFVFMPIVEWSPTLSAEQKARAKSACFAAYQLLIC